MKISIAMATYNGEKYLKEQLESIYAQTYKNIEVIVTDDCSSDKTVEILGQYSKSHGLKYVVGEQNIGFVKNFEKAIGLCTGEYIALADQDDIWEKDKLELLLNEIGTNLLIHSDCSIIDGEGNTIQIDWKKELGYRIKMEELFFSNVVTGCTVLFTKDLLRTAFPFPEGIAYHDWWLAICASKEHKIVYLNRSLTRYRQHNEQHTGAIVGKKTSLIGVVVKNILNRLNNVPTNRLLDSKKQHQNLLAVQTKKWTKQEASCIKDAMSYLDNYVHHLWHLRTFFIGLKYHKVLYPFKNYLFLKNILMDIVG